METEQGGVFLKREGPAALVRFLVKEEEDPRAQSQNGIVPTRDVEWVAITPPFSVGKSEVVKKAIPWLADCHTKAKNGAMDPRHVDLYQRQYDAWKKGQEMPIDGTPIRGWAMLTPAQQENCIRLNILTVEYLAQANDDGLRALGMGSLDLKRKAIAWLAQAQDKGPLTIEMTRMQKENDVLKASVETLQNQVQALLAQQEAPKRSHKRKETDE